MLISINLVTFLLVLFKKILGAQLFSYASCHLIAHTHHESPSFKPGKLNSGLGVLKSFPMDEEKFKKLLSIRQQTICRPRSCSLVLQKPSLKKPVNGLEQHSPSSSSNTFN